MGKSTDARIKRFIDDFIRSDFVTGLQSDRDSQFYGGYADRAARCWDAAEHGADGKTHAEVIQDWRDAFKDWINDRRRGRFSAEPDRFCTAVEAHFDRVETWHEQNGSLHEQIG